MLHHNCATVKLINLSNFSLQYLVDMQRFKANLTLKNIPFIWILKHVNRFFLKVFFSNLM